MESLSSKLEMKKDSTSWLLWALVSTFILLGIVLRFAGIGFRSMDIHDFLLDWYNELAAHGHDALKEPFSNYTPPYLYLLYLMVKTAGFIPRIAAIKLPSIGFDFLNAFLVYKILRIRYPHGRMAWIGASAFLLLPTVLLNSAYWGQADSIFTFFLLLCIFFLMQDQPLLAMISFGVSFAFKAQAAFLGPFLLLLTVKQRIPWYYIGIVPVVYGVMMIPAALAGRPVMELVTIYLGQADRYQMLSMNAPNLYLFIPSDLYDIGVALGLAITALVILLWVPFYTSKIKEFSPEAILLCAFVSAAFMPFFLPKMHDRYFYLADVLSFVVAFYFRQGWRLALGYQVVSGLVYFVFLRSSASMTRLQSSLDVGILFAAAVINTILMAYVFWRQWKLQAATDRFDAERLIQ